MHETSPSLMLNQPIKQQGVAEHRYSLSLLTTKSKLI